MEPTLVMATRNDGAQPPEAEPTLVEREGDEVVLHLEDGTELRYDALELRSAVAA